MTVAMTADPVAAVARGRPRRRRKGRAVHGWLVIDKPAGLTSTGVVGTARHLLGAAKAGHGGTLDPLARGVLPIAFGEATKTVPFVMDSLKCYRFTVRWGEARGTDDADGEVVATSAVRPRAEQIAAALPAFVGDIMQVPPDYSAVKVEGRRAYELARRAEPLTLEARPVHIERLELVEAADADHAVLEMECGKGAYVRALVRDLARALGTCGHVAALCRTRVGPFSLADAISLAELEALDDSGRPQRLLPVARGLVGVAALAVNADQALRLRQGRALPLVRPPVGVDGVPVTDGTVWASFADRPVALAELRGGELRPVRVFNY
jgi:tRNA pseudouridine55 synthase